jgi:hypothetical protein
VRPLLQAAFGRIDLYEIYAESIAASVARTGLPTMFSLGCGDGEQERLVLRAADRLGLPPFVITGIEVAPAVAERANRATEAADRAFLDEIGALERRLLVARATTPASMGGEFRLRRQGPPRWPDADAAMRAALRRPEETFPRLDDEPFRSPYPPQPPPPCPVLDEGGRCPVEPGSPAAAALHEGWTDPEEGGAWALLDEQFLRFRTATPIREVRLAIWSFLPAERGQRIAAVLAGGAAASTGRLAEGEATELRLAAERPTVEWEIRLSAHTYRHPDQDGGKERRPLAYRLTAIGVGEHPPPRGGLLRAWQRLLPRRR